MQSGSAPVKALRSGFMVVTVMALAVVILMLLSGQAADFQTLQPLTPLYCRSAPAITQSDLKMAHCQVGVALPDANPPVATGARARSADMALLVPVFRDALAVTVNGVTVGQARLNQWRMPARLATVPAIIPIPGGDLRPGRNRLDIAVWGLSGRDPILGKLYFGPEAIVVDQFHRLWFIAEVLPTLILGGQAALALMFLTIWNRRRQETALGWFALVLFLDTVRGSPIMPAMGFESSSVSYWSLLVPFSSAAYLMFARALVDMPTSWRVWLAWIGPTILVVAAAVLPRVVATGTLMPIGVAMILANLLAATVVLAIGWRRGIPEARLLCLCTILFASLVLHDVLLSLKLIDGRIAVARPGLLVLLVAMITLMINRFTTAMTELDRTAETLRQRTAEIGMQLKLAYEELREQRENAILAQERARLMRDLHDGLGGEMVAVLALAEQDDGIGAEIAYHARAALTDMRLIIASLEDYGGDLALALGAWKERAAPQIQSAGIVLHWDLADLGDDMHFGPTQILDILRILQEALTNAIHHAGAANITIGARLANEALVLTFADDGAGIARDARAGKGLINMRSRAAALDGAIEVDVTDQGTTIRLVLPQRITE